MRRGSCAARGLASDHGTALDIPAVITEEDPEMNGPTDEAVLASLRAGAPVFSKTVFGLAQLPRDHGGGQVNRTPDSVAGRF